MTPWDSHPDSGCRLPSVLLHQGSRQNLGKPGPVRAQTLGELGGDSSSSSTSPKPHAKTDTRTDAREWRFLYTRQRDIFIPQSQQVKNPTATGPRGPHLRQGPCRGEEHEGAPRSTAAK